MRSLVLLMLMTGCAGSSLQPPRPVIYADDLPIESPGSRSPSLAVEIIDKSFNHPLKQLLDAPHLVRGWIGSPYEAMNVDAFDEVPNTTWFTNRMGRHALSVEAIFSGPVVGGPDTTAAWTVIAFKSAGITPGLTIEDIHGDRYVIKLDPPKYPGLASGADVVGSRLLHAAGYNVPQNTISWLDPTRLRCAPGAKLTFATPDTRDPLREQSLMDDELQRRLSALIPEGQQRLRVLASRFLPGKPLGPFAYTGTRSDDANDVIPHEHRRELRGLYIICSWMNHADMKAENSLDMFDTQSQHVVHYLLDFGASMGSNSVAPSNPRRGVANSFDVGDAFVRWASLGVRVYPYESLPRTTTYPEVGYLNSDLFHPATWKPMYPAPPFDNLTDRDAFWGARIVTAFTDEHIAAAVAAGQFEQAAARQALIDFLVERRDRIGNYWFTRLNPLDGFRLEGAWLHFDDLAVQRGYADTAAPSYEIRVLDETGREITMHEVTAQRFNLDEARSLSRLLLDVTPTRAGRRYQPVRLYLSKPTTGWQLIGLRRL